MIPPFPWDSFLFLIGFLILFVLFADAYRDYLDAKERHKSVYLDWRRYRVD